MTGLDGFEIQKVSQDRISEVIDHMHQKKFYGLYYAQVKNSDKDSVHEYYYVACDNSTGDAWTEQFWTEENAIMYLTGELSDEYGLGFIDGFIIQEKAKDDPDASEYGKTMYVVNAMGLIIDTSDVAKEAKLFNKVSDAKKYIIEHILDEIRDCYSVIAVKFDEVNS